jgi:hypothetical protein
VQLKAEHNRSVGKSQELMELLKEKDENINGLNLHKDQLKDHLVHMHRFMQSIFTKYKRSVALSREMMELVNEKNEDIKVLISLLDKLDSHSKTLHSFVQHVLGFVPEDTYPREKDSRKRKERDEEDN